MRPRARPVQATLLKHCTGAGLVSVSLAPLFCSSTGRGVKSTELLVQLGQFFLHFPLAARVPNRDARLGYRSMIQQAGITLLDQQLRGERLSVETNEESWPLGRIIFIVLVSILVLWIGIHFAVRAIF